jgi:hypothetical protein
VNARTFTYTRPRSPGVRVLFLGILLQLFLARSARAQAPVIAEQPLGQTVLDCRPVTFSVVATGAGLNYQWFRDGFALTNATNSSYTLERARYSDDRSVFFVVISNDYGSVTSSDAILSVSQDPNVVFVRWAYGSNDALTIFVQFSTIVTNADDASNYLVFTATKGSSLGVESAVYVNGGTTGDLVVLGLSMATPMVFSNDYTMRVENVSDECGNLIASSVETPILKPVQLKLTPTAKGGALLEWTGNGTLQVATNLSNPVWENIANATSPYGLLPLNANRFFRVRVR